MDEQGSIEKQRLNWMLSSIYRLFGQKDFVEEVAFFVDMIFQNANDMKLQKAQFQELCLTQPLIRKCFQLDNPKQEKTLNFSEIAKGITDSTFN